MTIEIEAMKKLRDAFRENAQATPISDESAAYDHCGDLVSEKLFEISCMPVAPAGPDTVSMTMGEVEALVKGALSAELEVLCADLDSSDHAVYVGLAAIVRHRSRHTEIEAKMADGDLRVRATYEY